METPNPNQEVEQDEKAAEPGDASHEESTDESGDEG